MVQIYLRYYLQTSKKCTVPLTLDYIGLPRQILAWPSRNLTPSLPQRPNQPPLGEGVIHPNKFKDLNT